MTARLLISIAILVGAVSCATRAQAITLNKDAKAIGISSLYGVAAGTVVGLATLPLTQDIRATFMGSSIGLYMGIVVGIYYVLSRNDPKNPLRELPEPALLTARDDPRAARPLAQIAVPVLRF